MHLFHFFLSALGLSGIALSFVLTQHFFELHSGTGSFQSYCNAGKLFNCDQIAASTYAHLVSGLPVSSLATGFFLFAFLVACLTFLPTYRKESLIVLFWTAIAGLCFELPYLGIMIFRLKTFCLYCLGLDSITLTIAILTFFLLQKKSVSIRHFPSNRLKVGVPVGVVCLLVGVFGSQLIFGSGTLPEHTVNEMTQKVLSTPKLPMRTLAEFPSIGPASAPITIVEYSDFQCPYCRMAALTLHSLTQKYPDRVRVIFRNYPLDAACNSSVSQTVHPMACESAKVALCAHRLGDGAFEKIYNRLFEDQASLAPGKPIEWAKEVGLDAQLILSCATSEEATQAISRDVVEAGLLGVKLTPTLFIDGHKAEGALPLAVLVKLVEAIESGK